MESFGIIPAYAGSTLLTVSCRSPRLGSSPHTRGALLHSRETVREAGIIPAYAGSTGHALFAFPELGDHPRIRGEHLVAHHPQIRQRGSSPHTRGARVNLLMVSDFPPDHPRIRGEHELASACSDDDHGSSPHTRGALTSRCGRYRRLGIIPAYAGSTGRRARSGVAGGDHPRIRGEHRHRLARLVVGEGSSPHTRGAPRDPDIAGRPARIIPAYAGSTLPSLSSLLMISDHPRIRGEHDRGYLRPGVPEGSSPHTRGAPLPAWHENDPAGIIPAYAGSTSKSNPPTARGKDHPRIRGEHDETRQLIADGVGSSPHTRGARPRPTGSPPASWIIPAYAGSTRAGRRPCRRSEDHPRIRGEHLAIVVQLVDDLGSSPHTRGAHSPDDVDSLDDGIIPAYAGSTASRKFRPWGARDHPRIRGEHLPSQPAATLMPGSSPHTRGAPTRLLVKVRGKRIIPAYAGSTTSCSGETMRDGDHPRIRGEHEDEFVEDEGSDGSSPHTRGAHDIARDNTAATRIIPAYAGSTITYWSLSSNFWDHPRIRGEHWAMTRMEADALRIIPAYAGSTKNGETE